MLLSNSPLMGRPGELPGSRLFPVGGYPYLIVYKVDEARGVLSIASIVHMARDPRYIDPS